MMVRNNFEEKSAAYKVSYLSVYPKDQVITICVQDDGHELGLGLGLELGVM